MLLYSVEPINILQGEKMYDKLRTIQKMLRDQILKHEKLEKKHQKLLSKSSNIVAENKVLTDTNAKLVEENIQLRIDLENLKEQQTKTSKRSYGKSKSRTK